MGAATFRAGAASAIISPPAGAFIAGDKLDRHFTGVHDDLFVKALAVSDGVETVVLVSTDCLGLTYGTIQHIREKAAELVPELEPGHIVIGSTHIHTGPDVIGIYGADRAHSGLDPEYMARLETASAKTIADAVRGTRPASARYAVTTHGEGWVVNECEPQELDRSVTTLQFLDESGDTIATLTNFACHPTILDGVFNEVSTDWIGGYYRGMGHALGGTHLFMQGAIGGWVQPVDGARTFERADRLGHGLADAVLAALGKANELDEAKIRFAGKPLNLPLANEGWSQLAELGIIDLPLAGGVETEVAAFRIGEAEFATHPGETAPAFQRQTKALMQTEGPKFVLGLTIDALGYILKPEYFTPDATFPSAAYLTSMSVGPQTGPLMMKALEDVIVRVEGE
ncbi:MAG: alkaline ceramidase [Candidatus Hydrogenedens sp.]|nr:alkaline ceramidase [Candidatus Hydrogenedens sp.]